MNSSIRSFLDDCRTNSPTCSRSTTSRSSTTSLLKVGLAQKCGCSGRGYTGFSLQRPFLFMRRRNIEELVKSVFDGNGYEFIGSCWTRFMKRCEKSNLINIKYLVELTDSVLLHISETLSGHKNCFSLIWKFLPLYICTYVYF